MTGEPYSTHFPTTQMNCVTELRWRWGHPAIPTKEDQTQDQKRKC